MRTPRIILDDGACAYLTGLDLKHQVDYDWNIRGQLSQVTSPAGTFSYQYNEKSPALLDTITAPAHQVTYQYEPHRNLISSIKNISIHQRPSVVPPQQSPPTNISTHQRPSAVPSQQSPPAIISQYQYHNDDLGRRTAITQRGTAFNLLQLHGQNTVQVAYNDRSEVTGYTIRHQRTQQLQSNLPIRRHRQPNQLCQRGGENYLYRQHPQPIHPNRRRRRESQKRRRGARRRPTQPRPRRQPPRRQAKPLHVEHQKPSHQSSVKGRRQGHRIQLRLPGPSNDQKAMRE